MNDGAKTQQDLVLMKMKGSEEVREELFRVKERFG